MLKSIADFIKALDEHQINYCHWKSNEHLNEALTEGYTKLIRENIDRSMSHIDIAALIEDKINSMPIEELERLILTVMKKELNTIVSLGALIGVIMGLLGNLLP